MTFGVRRARVRLGSTLALDDVTLEVEPGSVVAVVAVPSVATALPTPCCASATRPKAQTLPVKGTPNSPRASSTPKVAPTGMRAAAHK